jgi:uncharacterized membrane protein
VSRTATAEVVYFLVEDPATGIQHRLYPVEYEVAQLLDGSRSLEKVARLVNKRRKISLQAVDVEKFARQLQALGFVVEEGEEAG